MQAERSSTGGPWAADALAGAALVAAVLLLYHRVLGLWWSHDDFFHLHFVSQHAAWRYCLEPRVWRLLPFRMLTPLLLLSLEGDLRAFGADPRAFFAHQLVAAALAALALYAALRGWLRPAPAALGALVALAGIPASSAIQMLMERHYVEGMVLAGLAVALFARKDGGAAALAGSAACYLAACLAKEVFVPLVVVFVAAAMPAERADTGVAAHPLRTVALGLRRAGLHVGCFLLYLGWRYHMLGTLGGGYGWSVRAADLPALAAALPEKLWGALGGDAGAPGLVLMAALAAGAAVVCWSGRRATLFLLVALGAAVAPILPISTEMQPRYALAVSLVLAAALAFACARLAAGEARRARGGRRGDRADRADRTDHADRADRADRADLIVAVALGGVALIAALAVNRSDWSRSFAAATRVSVEDRALAGLPAGWWLRQPAEAPASLRELLWFRRELLHRPAAGGGWFCDDLFLGSLPATARLVQYDARTRRVAALPPRAAGELRAAYGASLRGDAPLAAELELAGGDLRWRLGPYAEGAYALVLGNGADAYAVPAAGGFQVPRLRQVALRVHYTSPRGWSTYSPPLTVAAGGGAVRYRRPG